MLKTIIIFYVRALRAHAEFFSVTFKSQNPDKGAEEKDISLPEQPETPPAEEEAAPQGQALHNAAQTGGQIQPAEGGAGPEEQPAEAAQGYGT